MTAPTQTVEEFFAGGAKPAKFDDRAYGTVIGGEIVADPVIRQQRDYETDELMTYPDGNPMMQMLVTVQAQPPTDEDDGQRTFYIKNQLKQAVADALRKVGAKAPRRGGRLWVKYLSDEPVTLKNGKRGNDKKIHAAKYEPPAQAAAADFYAEPTTGGAAEDLRSRAVDDARMGNGNAPGGLACPAGIDPGKWAQMNPAQRSQMYDALSLPSGGVAQTPAGGNAFRDEPPF